MSAACRQIFDCAFGGNSHPARRAQFTYLGDCAFGGLNGIIFGEADPPAQAQWLRRSESAATVRMNGYA